MDRNDLGNRNIGPDWNDMDMDWLNAVGKTAARERAGAADTRWIPAERRSAAEHLPRHAAETEDIRPRHAAEEEDTVTARPRHAAWDEEEEAAARPRHAASETEDIRPRHAAAEDEPSLSRDTAAAQDETVLYRRVSEPEAAARSRRSGAETADAPARRTGAQGTRSGKSGRRASETAWEASRRGGRRVAPAEREDYRRTGRGRGRNVKLSVPIIALIAVLVIGMGVAGWQLISIFLGYQRDRSAYNDIAERAISALAEQDVLTNDEGEPIAEDGSVISEVPISVDWDYLRSLNSDIVGWLYCPGTVINYPVVQTSNNDFYLTHGFTRESNKAGALFADLASVTGVSLSHLIVYGHNMKDNSMFGTYQHYVDVSYYEQNPVMYYLTPNENYRVELICAHLVEGTMDNFPAYFNSDAEYMSYINAATSRAFWVNYEAISTDHQLLTMSTCTSAQGFSDARLLVEGSLVPIA